MARLLHTKLQPPPLRVERVYRPYLYEDLVDFDSGVVLVSAPPGYGKSTLVVEWLTAQSRPFAWFSLDRYDSDVGLFGEYMALAVSSLTGGETGLISIPGALTPDPRAITTTLIDDLARAPDKSVLVLDDYHEIHSTDVHGVVNYLVDNLPDGIVLAIVTRADPPIPLSRLRNRGRLREIRGTDLRFGAPEVAEYFMAAADIALEGTQLLSMTERSEGWISALQLVAIGIDESHHPDVGSALSARHPHIASYLVDEFLDHLKPELIHFLLDTSPFERFDAQLCRDAAGIADPGRLIAEIERRNAFLIPLDNEAEWYRYHHLFAELLRSRLERSDPDRRSELLRRAAVSCEERNLPDDAIDCALKAGDLVLATGIVERNMGAALGAGEMARLRSWLRRFPVPAGEASHVLALGWAWCRIFEGNMEAANELIDRIEDEHLGDFAQNPRGQLEVMRAMTEFQAGDTRSAESHARLGVTLLPKPSLYMESVGHLYVGRALHAQGKRSDARPHLERAASLAERGNTLAAVSALFWLGVVDMDQGNLVDAERSMKRAQEVGAKAVEPKGGKRPGEHPAAGIGDIGLAYIRLNQLEAGDAIQLAERGTRLLKRTTFVEMVFRAMFVWAEALSVAGRYQDAETVIDEGIEWLQGRSIAGGPLETWLLMARARNSWRRGRLDESAATLDEVRQRGLGSPQADEALGFYEAADAVAFALRRRDLEEGRRLLAELPTDPTGNVMFAIKRHALTAALQEMEGEPRAAVRSLESALDLAHDGYRFQFSFGGPALEPVLKRLVGRSAHDEFLRTLIEKLPREADRAPHQPVDPLTEREVEVLAEIAAGYTNEEIADRLFISRGTVKRHASNIYMKLGAHHRTEAAALGRDLGLID